MAGADCARPMGVALVAGPAIIVAHECGHYLAALALGLQPTLHYAFIQPRIAAHTRLEAVVMGAGGPAVELSLTMAGLLWLSRRSRLGAGWNPNLADWIATACACCAVRWVTYHRDEAELLKLLGMPSAIRLLFLAISIAALVVTIRMHPPGKRLLPFGAAVIGSAMSIALWLFVLGPRLLP